MLNRILEPLIRVVATLVAVGVPLLLAVQLVRAAGAPGEQLARGLLGGQVLLAQATTPTADTPGTSSAAAAGLPLVSGVLFSRGAVGVDWNGVSIPVRDGSYAYVGGETVRVPAGAIAVLRLPGGAQVTLCGGSQTALTPLPGGGYRLDVAGGAARFRFPAQIGFSVHANGTTVSPDPRGSADAMFEGEVQARKDGTCLVCELGRGVRVSRGAAPLDTPSGTDVGRVIEVAAAGAQGGPALRSTPIPPRLMAAASGAGTPLFLCRCEDLLRETQEAATQPVQEARAQEETPAEAPSDGPQALAEASVDEPPPVPVPQPSDVTDSAPPSTPPDAPLVAVAEPGAPDPDPFDPNVLPPPAAGEPASPLVVLPPPAVPFSGTGTAAGGGGVAGAPPGSGPDTLPPLSGGGGGPPASPS